MEKEIVCDCGWSARGTEEELVEAAQQHGREIHNMVPTHEQVLAIAKPATDSHDEQ
jgi:predicted small metal-binding protein